ncbi:zona pellucida sperm-binding protein 3-like [Hyperolius riggenbachi]|uniref:zona pellucida sperm-binding protein 3-like n=1 Tax=Hyperolius riggenbachi TaxID=752182 RepID=UPI0035A2F73B
MAFAFLNYSTSLLYNPTSTRNFQIARTNSTVVLIACYYFRADNVSNNAIKPIWSPLSIAISPEEKLSFNLLLITENWSSPRNCIVYQLGEHFSIEASVETPIHVGLILFIDRCVATPSPDPTSVANYTIVVSANRCLVDGILDDSSSAFLYPISQAEKLQSTVDAFRFVDTAQSERRRQLELENQPTTVCTAVLQSNGYPQVLKSAKA